MYKFLDSRHGAMNRRRFLTLSGRLGAAATLALPGAFSRPLAAAESEKLPIGMNLAGIADWAPGFPFRNVMWGARPWSTKNEVGEGPWDTQLNDDLETDGDGYPLEVPFRSKQSSMPQIAFTVLPNVLTPGRYVLLYDGDGDIGGVIGTRVLEAAPGRVVLGMQHRGDGLVEGVSILRSTRGNHIRNMRIVALEEEGANLDEAPFRSDFLAFCKPWHCLRFMDWQQTNGSINRSWKDRKTRSFYTQVGSSGDLLGRFAEGVPVWRRKWSSGVALELCIQLANLTKTDAWLCVPHLADDDYIAMMAKLTRDTLDPSLKVYLEFSNEVWNWQFPQAQWMVHGELASDLVIAAGAPPPWASKSKPDRFIDGVVAEGAGEGVDHPERTGALFRRCFAIWEDVFRNEDRRRLVRVCAVQSGWTDTVDRTLRWVTANGGCDALSPAGYFGPYEEYYRRWDAKGASLTADDVIADMAGALDEAAQFLKENAALAKGAGVRLVAYEGGQHIQPEGQQEKPYLPALGQAQKHPKMYDLYRRNMDMHARLGCDLFCAFNSIGHQGSRYGSWGHVERYGQDPAEMPKYRALLDANTAR
ncbi:MAG: hypothetical protein ACT4OU_13260 [Hyphomicrobium sp.]